MARPDARSFASGPWPWVGAAGILVAAAAWLVLGGAGAGVARDPRPLGDVDDLLALAERDDVNVLFVLIDTLRADHLGFYDYERDTSPVIDALAAEGIVFARHLSQSSWTKCSMASLWTGLNPARTGVTRFDDRLSDEAVHAAEIFQEAGFVTAGLWRNGWVEGYFGFDQGFDVYARPASRVTGPPTPNPTLHVGGTDLDLVEGARGFLRVHGNDRWFLYLHMMDVHEFLYDEKTAVFGSGNVDVYDNAILRSNGVLELLASLLYETGQLERTVIVLASDHGEAFGERGFEGHARDVYPETTEVPLVLSLPFRLERPVVVRRRTANVDLWPTLLDLLGLPPLEEADGRSRLPDILAAARDEPGPTEVVEAVAHLDQTWGQRVKTTSPNVQISRGGIRYLQFRNAEGALREQLFDFQGDPDERRDRAGERPEETARFRALARGYLESEPPWGERPDPLEIDEMQLNQLRALGYRVP